AEIFVVAEARLARDAPGDAVAVEIAVRRAVRGVAAGRELLTELRAEHGVFELDQAPLKRLHLRVEPRDRVRDLEEIRNGARPAQIGAEPGILAPSRGAELDRTDEDGDVAVQSRDAIADVDLGRRVEVVDEDG